jgi:hypothetical protein
LEEIVVCRLKLILENSMVIKVRRSVKAPLLTFDLNIQEKMQLFTPTYYQVYKNTIKKA